MDWEKWLGFNIYKKLWSLIGGRPWTYIYRDIWDNLEWFPQMQWAVTGVVAEYIRQMMHWPWWAHFIWVGIYSFGYINGHFFWGRDKIFGQRGD